MALPLSSGNNCEICLNCTSLFAFFQFGNQRVNIALIHHIICWHAVIFIELNEDYRVPADDVMDEGDIDALIAELEKGEE